MKFCKSVKAWIFYVVVIISVVAALQLTFGTKKVNPVDEGKVKNSHYQQEYNCLTQALWYEARGESTEGLRAVASVIYNRVQSKQYPDTYCKVIHQPWQFSYVQERQQQGLSLNIKPEAAEENIYQEIQTIAKNILEGEFKPSFPKQVMWYHTKHVKPKWSKAKEKVAQIKNHVFYRKKEKS